MPRPIACPEPSYAYATKWASESRMQTLIGARLARESPATCRSHADSVHVAWPIVRGHSWVLHPGQNWLPGHMFAGSTGVLAGRHAHRGSNAILPKFGAFFLIFRRKPTASAFSRSMRSVLARERQLTCLMDSGGISRAWPTVHGHSWVVHPGRSCLPGHNMSSMMVAMMVAWRRILF